MINHKTSDELRRAFNRLHFSKENEAFEPFIREIIDAYENSEKQLKALESLINGKNE